MNILESLREKKKALDIGTIKEGNFTYELLNQYDLALENVLLKLGNRSTQIKDLRHRAGQEAKNLNEVIGKVLAWVKNEEKGKEIINLLEVIQSRLRI